MEPIVRESSTPNRMVDFMVTAYMPDANGVLQAVLPCRCLKGAGEESCRLKRHSVRVRKSILETPLTILRCATHGGYLTLYPPGFTPYARLPIMHCDALNRPMVPENSARDPWLDTRLELPVPVLRRRHDADTESQGVARKSRQRSGSRRVAFASTLLGVRGASQRLIEQLSVLLSLVLSNLMETTATMCTTWVGWVKLLRPLLAALVMDQTLLSRLMEAGYRTALFGKAWVVRPQCGSVFPFRSPEQT